MTHEKTPAALNSLMMKNLLPESGSQPHYEHIELELEETEEALRLAREAKHYRLKREAWASEIMKPITYVSHTAEQLYELAVATGMAFASPKHEAQFKHLCSYFASDTRSAYDLHKGILILGKVGSGKSTIMKFFASNQHHSYRVESMIDITSDYKTHGEKGVEMYNINFQRSPNVYGLTSYGYCFDDLGTEEIPAKHYGEAKNVFAEIMQLRYHASHLVPYKSTHATTNKDLNELKDLYGSRAYDRMKEMFNVVVFDHGSFRG
jgi:DNA replication protein DnaC